MDTHFFFDRAAEDWVTCAQAAIGIDQEFWYQEQRNTFGAFWCVWQASQYQVDDVFCAIMFTSRDKDLGASNFVSAVTLWFCFGTQHAKVSTAVWFGQAHGTCPFTGS